MVCLGFEPGATGWKAQMKPQSYGGHPLAGSCLEDEEEQLYRIGTRVAPFSECLKSM